LNNMGVAVCVTAIDGQTIVRAEPVDSAALIEVFPPPQ
jgi:hypothetical protein